MDQNSFSAAASVTGPATNPTLHAIEAELARANVARIRGDVDGAKAICLKVLKQFPNAAEPHVMLGDLNAEQGLLKNAVEWYNLALDIEPSAAIISKRDKCEQAYQASAARQKPKFDPMGTDNRRMSLAITGVAVASGIAALAFFAGSQTRNAGAPQKPVATQNAKSTSKPGQDPELVAQKTGPVTQPVSPRPALEPSPVQLASALNDSSKPEAANPKPANREDRTILRDSADDSSLFEQIQVRSNFAENLRSVMNDPRDNALIVTYSVNKQQHGRYVGACLADTALDYNATANKVVLRGFRGGVLAYMADVNRDKLVTVKAKRGDLQACEDHSWINEVLSNEYFKGRNAVDPGGLAPASD